MLVQPHGVCLGLPHPFGRGKIFFCSLLRVTGLKGGAPDGLHAMLQDSAMSDPLRVAAVSTVVLQDSAGTVSASAALSTAVPPDQALPLPPVYADAKDGLTGPAMAEANPPQPPAGTFFILALLDSAV